MYYNVYLYKSTLRITYVHPPRIIINTLHNIIKSTFLFFFFNIPKNKDLSPINNRFDKFNDNQPATSFIFSKISNRCLFKNTKVRVSSIYAGSNIVDIQFYVRSPTMFLGYEGEYARVDCEGSSSTMIEKADVPTDPRRTLEED